MSMTQINWYPGHMKKTKDLIKENLKLIDVVLEIVDARIPISSKNPDIANLSQTKKRIIVLNKSDLVSKEELVKWKEYFKNKGDILWDLVISFDSYDTLDKYNLKSTQDFYYVLNKSLPKYFNSIGVENDNVLWWSNLHTNTANPHLHLCFLEKDKTRTRGKVAVKHLKGLKKFLVNELIKREKVKNNSKIIGIELLNKMKNSQKEIKKKIYNFDFTTIKKLEEFYKKLFFFRRFRDV